MTLSLLILRNTKEHGSLEIKSGLSITTDFELGCLKMKQSTVLCCSLSPGQCCWQLFGHQPSWRIIRERNRFCKSGRPNYKSMSNQFSSSFLILKWCWRCGCSDGINILSLVFTSLKFYSLWWALSIISTLLWLRKRSKSTHCQSYSNAYPFYALRVWCELVQR